MKFQDVVLGTSYFDNLGEYLNYYGVTQDDLDNPRSALNKRKVSLVSLVGYYEAGGFAKEWFANTHVDAKGKLNGRHNQAVLVQRQDGAQYHARLRNLVGEWDSVIAEQLEITRAKNEKSAVIAAEREARRKYEVEVREPALEKLYDALAVVDPQITMDHLWKLPDETVQYLAKKVAG